MSQFKLSSQVDKNKVFLVNHSELERRLDIDFYRPNIMTLEKIIRQKSTKKLNDFIVCMKSGATPLVTEEEKFYSDAEKGVPFLRVQNLNTSGEISLEGVRYINKETHEKYLKRSQVSEGNLLVKITGVGRMAIASVAPESFVGNTNQHMVVIKTTSNEQSRYLANYLNLDITEALATRRTTGGTRPALDYPALRSIPIIEGIDFSVLKQAEQIRKQKEQQAQALLAGIDAYLLAELGIELDEQDNSLITRMFKVQFSEISSSRFDPLPLDVQTKNLKKQLKGKLKSIISDMYRYPTFFDINYQEKGIKVIKGESINSIGDISPNQSFDFIDDDTHNKFHRTQIKYNDLIFTVRGLVGKVGIYKLNEDANINANVIKISLLDSVNPDFYWSYLNSSIGKKIINSLTSGQVQKTITVKDIHNIDIPLIHLEKQNEIAKHIAHIRNQAKQLQTEAAQILADAKAEVERMILGEKA